MINGKPILMNDEVDSQDISGNLKLDHETRLWRKALRM